MHRIISLCMSPLADACLNIQTRLHTLRVLLEASGSTSPWILKDLKTDSLAWLWKLFCIRETTYRFGPKDAFGWKGRIWYKV